MDRSLESMIRWLYDCRTWCERPRPSPGLLSHLRLTRTSVYTKGQIAVFAETELKVSKTVRYGVGFERTFTKRRTTSFRRRQYCKLLADSLILV